MGIQVLVRSYLIVEHSRKVVLESPKQTTRPATPNWGTDSKTMLFENILSREHRGSPIGVV